MIRHVPHFNQVRLRDLDLPDFETYFLSLSERRIYNDGQQGYREHDAEIEEQVVIAALLFHEVGQDGAERMKPTAGVVKGQAHAALRRRIRGDVRRRSKVFSDYADSIKDLAFAVSGRVPLSSKTP